MEIITFQQEFRPELPNVYGTHDYRIFRDILIKIDEVLSKSDLERDLVSEALRQSIKKDPVNRPASGNKKKLNYRYKIFRHALRCNIARHLTGESYRLFSLRLADSTLFQWFTGINDFGSRKAISKSALDRYEKYFDETQVSEKIRDWMRELSEGKKALNAGLVKPLNIQKAFIDSTGVKADIHYPVDWLLLRDASRSLLSAIKTIRAQGLKHRMMDPSSLMKKMNGLCMQMTHARRQKESKKNRKLILSFKTRF